MVRVRDFNDGLDNVFPNPWSASTDEHGQATLELPSGNEILGVKSGAYELPILQGQRAVDVRLSSGKPTEVTLRLQPQGTETLGDQPP
jgi:hypothetical protein